METQAPRRLSLTVTPAQSGEKIDTLLRRDLHLSGTVIRRIKQLEDGILLDGVRAITGQRTAEGQVLSALVSDPCPRLDMAPTPGSLDVVYEDEDILVVNKAAGLPVHPGPGRPDGTLCNHIAWYYQQTGLLADIHLVHRLDKGTSGLMVVAKHAHAQEQLKLQLHTPAFRRLYLAVCDGAPQPPSGTVDAPIARAPGSVIARRVDPEGQWARTRYRTLRAANGRSLVELELDSGRTHQIRVHMAHLGCPLTGDFLYGTEDQSLISRPALHSARLSLTHPVTGASMYWELPLPPDMAALLA